MGADTPDVGPDAVIRPASGVSAPEVETPEVETSEVEAPEVGAPDADDRRAGGTAAAVWTLVGLLVVLVAASAWHLTQGTSGAVFADPDILLGSRLPRLAAGVAVGLALGVAGLLMQSLARNPLASPDTLG